MPTATRPAATNRDLDAIRLELELYVRSSYASLIRTARRVVSNLHDAEEAVQDGLLAATRALPRFRGDARLSTWVHTIVRNAATRVRCRRGRREVALEDVLGLDEDDGPLELAGLDPSPDAALARDEFRRELRDALARLPAEQARLLRWRELEGRDNDEIASRLGIRGGAARVRVHRARLALRSQLDLDGGIAPRPGRARRDGPRRAA